MKQKILYAAEKLFTKSDFEEVSIKQICKVAEISNGSFYYHIGSKENLFKIFCASSDEIALKKFLQNGYNKDIFQKIESAVDITADFALKYGHKFAKHFLSLRLSDYIPYSESYLLRSQMKLLVKEAYVNNYFTHDYTEEFIFLYLFLP